MPVILILILVSLTLALAFLAGFIWAVRSGQYEDTCTPAMRILTEDAPAADESARARAHSRTLREIRAPQSGRQLLECASPLALSQGHDNDESVTSSETLFKNSTSNLKPS